MTDNDNDGERELVLGNKQLLGIFFVATLLCGVFFAMGYVVGGNSAKSSAAAAAADNASAPTVEGKREEPQAPQTSSQSYADSGANAGAANSSAGDSGSPFPAAESRVSDNPAAAGAAPPPTAPAPVQSAPIPAPVTVAKSTPASPVRPEPQVADTGIVLSTPEKGASYWQVTATPRPAADALVQSLRARHLPAILAESSNPKLFRVLVGPYRSQLTMKDAKQKLADIGGFDGLIAQKF